MTAPEGALEVSAADRATLERLADVLIPAGDGMPSASEAGIGRDLLDLVLTARPDLHVPLVALLQAGRDRDPGAFVAELQADDPDGFGVLAQLVPGGYFMNPAVRRALGYKGQRARPFDPDRRDPEVDALLQSVIDRGPIYRPTP